MTNAVLVALAKSVKDLRAAFVNLSKLPGPQGDPGRDGVDGKDGAEGRNGVDGRNGADGRDGVDGKDGRPGKDGIAGNPGRDGKDGKDGEAGPMGPMPKHEWRGTELRFQLTPKKWGKWVNLKGPAGSSGSVVVQDGGTNLDSLPPATDETPDLFVVKQDGKWALATYEQMTSWFGGQPPIADKALLTEAGEEIRTESGEQIVQE